MKMKVEKLTRLFIVLLIFGFIMYSVMTAYAQSNVMDIVKKPANPKLEHKLDRLITDRSPEILIKEYGISIDDTNSLRVIINMKEINQQYLDILNDFAVRFEILDKNENIIQAKIPLSKLNSVADLSFVNYISEPELLEPFVTSEGVATINATILHSLGINGTGRKIAVLDGGFEGYLAKLGTELPSNVITRSFRADGNISAGEVHGTAVAEIVHDVAPAAQLYLINCATKLECNNATNWLIGQNVDIISFSAGWYDGPKDGTDYADRFVNNATASGILWVNAAGNEANKHWMGNFSDPNNNRIHNFTINDETQEIRGILGQDIQVILTWDDWPYSSQDYDLYLLNNSGQIVARSETYQTGTQPPIERITYRATYTGNYSIQIRNYSANRNVKFHLYSPRNPTMQYIVPNGSVIIPGTSTGALTIGATNWSNDILESYSSQGPTDDGRIKPDIVAPSDVLNSVYGRFRGTSASAPHASAASALLLQINPNLTISQLKQALENGARDLEPPGKDNQFGAGRIDVYNSAQLISPLSSGISLGEALDNTLLNWTTGGNAPWFGQNTTYYYGGDAAQSGRISDNQNSWIQTTVTGPGTLRFHWKVSSETNYGYIEFYIDGIRQDRITGEVDWQQKSFDVGTGLHTLRWKYVKGSSP